MDGHLILKFLVNAVLVFNIDIFIQFSTRAIWGVTHKQNFRGALRPHLGNFLKVAFLQHIQESPNRNVFEKQFQCVSKYLKMAVASGGGGSPTGCST